MVELGHLPGVVAGGHPLHMLERGVDLYCRIASCGRIMDAIIWSGLLEFGLDASSADTQRWCLQLTMTAVLVE